MTWFSSRFEAMGAEQDAILRVCPRYNEQLGVRSLPMPRLLLNQRPYPDLVHAYWQAENETLAAYQTMAKAVIRALDRGADAEAVAAAVGLSRTHVDRLHEQWKANRQRRREAKEDCARRQARARERAANAALQAIETDEGKLTVDSDDMEKLAISSLAGLGTAHGAGLAMEIQRGMDRRHGRDIAHPAEVEVPENFTMPATVHQYLLWLDGFVERGGRPNYDYDYRFGHRGWLYAPCGFTVNGECGARSMRVIVEHGAEVQNPNPWKPFGGYGHNTLYLMDESRLLGHSVPIYSDPEFDPYREMVRRG